MSLIKYVADENPDGLRAVLVDFGVKNANTMNPQQLATAATQVFRQNPEGFYEKLYEQHPDKEIFEEKYKAKTVIPEQKRTEEPTQHTPKMKDNCIFNSLPEPVKNFYSGDYKLLKIAGTVALAVWLIRKF